MAMRSKRDFVAGRLAARRAAALPLALAFAGAACSPVPNAMYTGPGWYLEKPVQLFVAGPQIYAGPFSYDQCEAERTKLPQSTAELMLCFRHLAPPGVAGPYVTANDVRWGALPPPPSASPTAPPSPDATVTTKPVEAPKQ